jgi:hypothetical protein
MPSRAYTKYPSPQATYMRLYAVGARTLKRWITDGRQCVPPDLPPLHRPTEMPAWWNRVKKTPVPVFLLQIAERHKDFSGEVPPPEKSLVVADQPLTAAVSSNTDSTDHLEKLREHMEAAERRLAIALTSGSAAAIAQAERSYGAFADLYRKTRETEYGLKKTLGDLIPKQQSQTELAQLIEDWRSVRLDLPARIEAAMQHGSSLHDAVAKASEEEESILCAKATA